MTIAKYLSWCALGCFAVGSALCAADSVTAGGPAAVGLLLGHWEPDSEAFHDMGITITATRITLGKCGAVPYSIVKDAQGQGPDAMTAQDAAGWHEIVIELQPSKGCERWKVLAISVPGSKQTRADIAFYASRGEFESKPNDFGEWGVWEKDDTH